MRRIAPYSVLSTVLGVLAAIQLWSIGASAQAPQTCAVYPVTIQGTVSTSLGSQQFAVSEFLVVLEPGFSQNPVDFLLTSNMSLNSLSGAVQPGLINLMSNTATGANVGAASQMLDVAAVTAGSGALQFRLEPALGLQQPGVNTLVGPGGQGGQAAALGGLGFAPGFNQFTQILSSSAVIGVVLLAPVRGGGSFQFQQGGTVSGALDVEALQVDNPSLLGRYVANVEGGPGQPCPQQTIKALKRKGVRHGK